MYEHIPSEWGENKGGEKKKKEHWNVEWFPIVFINIKGRRR